MKIIEIAEVHGIWIIKRTAEVKRERSVSLSESLLMIGNRKKVGTR
jgi:hypothetical protein